jgi:hypothetical protein
VFLLCASNRRLSNVLLSGVFAAGGIAACLVLRQEIARRPKFLSATLEELRKDAKKLERP